MDGVHASEWRSPSESERVRFFGTGSSLLLTKQYPLPTRSGHYVNTRSVCSRVWLSNGVAMPLPHEEVLVRLGVSKIHGIGVFAQQLIKTGSNIFGNDTRAIYWVPASVLDDGSLNDFQRRFYLDFAIRRGDELGCPANFNLLTVGWYVNEPAAGDEPNLIATTGFDLVASRDIEPGEERTIRYSSLNGAAG